MKRKHKYSIGELCCWHNNDCVIQIISQGQLVVNKEPLYKAIIIKGKPSANSTHFREGQEVGCEEHYMWRVPMEPIDILKEML